MEGRAFLATKIIGFAQKYLSRGLFTVYVQILSLSSTAISCMELWTSQITICWLLPKRPEFFNAMNNHLKKKRPFSLSFIYARCRSLFYTDLFSAIVGKMGSSAGFSVVYVYTAELFPTQVHNLIFFLFSKVILYFTSSAHV
jgi:hypothetical protein